MPLNYAFELCAQFFVLSTNYDMKKVFNNKDLVKEKTSEKNFCA